MNKYFCKAPFIQLEFSPQGECRVCCKMHDPVLKDDGEQYKIQSSTVTEIWKSNWMENFRERCITEEKRPECDICWKDEEAGIFSYRKQLEGAPFCNVDDPNLAVMVLKLSNKCNCACRICDWYLSSLWQSEKEKTNRIKLDNLHNSMTPKITDENWEDWKKNLGEVDHLALYGGEPLINDEVIQILQYLIDIGRSDKVNIGLNTNGTITSKKIFEMLNQFSAVALSFSIDDIGERYNYERWPAESEKILSELQDIHDNRNYEKIYMHLYTTISVFNVLNIDEILTKFKEFNKWGVNFDNILHNPEYLSIVNLPENVKPKVEEYLNSFNWEDTNWIRINEDYKKNVINFMYLNTSQYTCEEYINKLDKELGFDDLRRKQDWRKTFSKLYELLKTSE
jgi:MoaA/NifB/PqqE/SkfB family radical SAM enzyme